MSAASPHYTHLLGVITITQQQQTINQWEKPQINAAELCILVLDMSCSCWCTVRKPPCLEKITHGIMLLCGLHGLQLQNTDSWGNVPRWWIEVDRGGGWGLRQKNGRCWELLKLPNCLNHLKLCSKWCHWNIYVEVRMWQYLEGSEY